MEDYDSYEGRTRGEYLSDLAEYYEVSIDFVNAISASLGGEAEDFDGLITALEDWEECNV